MNCTHCIKEITKTQTYWDAMLATGLVQYHDDCVNNFDATIRLEVLMDWRRYQPVVDIAEVENEFCDHCKTDILGEDIVWGEIYSDESGNYHPACIEALNKKEAAYFAGSFHLRTNIDLNAYELGSAKRFALSEENK